MKKNILLPFFICFIAIASAQDYVDLAKIYYQNTPQNNFDTTRFGSTNVQEFGADLTLPIKLGNGNAVLTGLTYNNVSLSLNENTDLNVQDLTLKIGMNVNHSERFSGTYLLLPRLASDFKKMGSDDFQFGAVAIFKLKKSESFKYKFGLFYSAELYGSLLVPFVGCYYISDNEKFELDLSLPVAADANYSLAKKLKVGLRYTTAQKAYNLNKAYTLSAVNYPDTYLKKYTIEAFSYLRYTLAESFLFTIDVGYAVGRDFEMSENGEKHDLNLWSIGFGDDPKVLNSPFENGLIYRIGFSYRFNIKKENN